MRIGIISDTHGSMIDIEKTIDYLKTCDLIIHAGDYVDDAEYLHYATDIEVKSVKGNCDLYTRDENYELTFYVCNKKFFLCHGHYYDVKYGLNSLVKLAKDNNINIVVFGHTHIPLYKTIDNITFINPGSITYPRGESEKSFGILTIKNEEVSYENINI